MIIQKRKKEIIKAQIKKKEEENKKLKEKELLKKKKIIEKKKKQDQALAELFDTVDRKGDSKGTSSNLKDMMAEDDDGLGGLADDGDTPSDDNKSATDMEIQLEDAQTE